jgi:hypothetical protein
LPNISLYLPHIIKRYYTQTVSRYAGNERTKGKGWFSIYNNKAVSRWRQRGLQSAPLSRHRQHCCYRVPNGETTRLSLATTITETATITLPSIRGDVEVTIRYFVQSIARMFWPLVIFVPHNFHLDAKDILLNYYLF